MAPPVGRPRSSISCELGLAGQHRGEQHAVIGEPRLVADHRDRVAAERGLGELVDQTRGRHTVTDDDQRFTQCDVLFSRMALLSSPRFCGARPGEAGTRMRRLSTRSEQRESPSPDSTSASRASSRLPSRGECAGKELRRFHGSVALVQEFQHALAALHIDGIRWPARCCLRGRAERHVQHFADSWQFRPLGHHHDAVRTAARPRPRHG